MLLSIGMIWPESIAPYRACIVPISKDNTINTRAEKLYDQLQHTMLRGDIVLDDRYITISLHLSPNG
jgi:prolyl-tRNA synthetase